MSEYQDKFNIVEKLPPFNENLIGRYKLGFAYYTMNERLPRILTQIIDQLSKDKEEIYSNFKEESKTELKDVIGEISKLKYELQTDKPFNPITGNFEDVGVWNNFIDSLGNDNTYYSALWLYAETYMYRRLKNIFENTNTLKDLDYFKKQKEKALTNSFKLIEEALVDIDEFYCAKNEQTTIDIEHFFIKLLKLNLWGNRVDLSISAGKEITHDHEDPFELLATLDDFIVSNHSNEIWKCVNDARGNDEILIEIINDNSGYEFFTDLCLADFLIEFNLAKVVGFNVKAIPWYISDLTKKDVQWTLKSLSNHSNKFIAKYGQRWTSFFETGQFKLNDVDLFWTSPYEYSRMKELNENLYNSLSKAHLVIFKGDLNYRKLLADFNFEYTEPFRNALRGFLPTNLCTLRTVKADLICGLRPGQADELFAKDANWMTTGDFGVIQYTNKLDSQL